MIWDTGRYDLVTASAAVIHPDERLEWCGEHWGLERGRSALERDSNVMAGVSIRVALAREAGGRNPAVPRTGDWDLWKRALDAGGRAVAIGDPTGAPLPRDGARSVLAERVRQNTAWSERMSHPEGLARIRRLLGALRDERDARVLDLLTERERDLARLRATRWWRLRVWLNTGPGRRLRRLRADGRA